jgi:hypothetical protein
MAAAAAEVQLRPLQGPSTLDGDPIVLKNDSFRDEGGQAYLQLGFVAEEKAGIWVQVPQTIPYFKVDFFRVLIGSGQTPFAVSNDPVVQNTQVFFEMAVANDMTPGFAPQLVNAAQLTPGPYWNDIPAEGYQGETLPCVRAGQYVGAGLEFTHSGAPSVYRDIDGLAAVKGNLLCAVGGGSGCGWAYSVQYGLRGDWILRVVGHEATAEECNM